MALTGRPQFPGYWQLTPVRDCCLHCSRLREHCALVLKKKQRPIKGPMSTIMLLFDSQPDMTGADQKYLHSYLYHPQCFGNTTGFWGTVTVVLCRICIHCMTMI